VTVEGGVAGMAEGRELRLAWRETGGPPVARPARPGYGTLLLSQAIAYGRGGDVGLDWRREGLVCTIRVPLATDATGTARAA
jgi:two-component sensor histidine kinase